SEAGVAISGGPGLEEATPGGGGGGAGGVCIEQIRAAPACARSSEIIHVLDGRTQTGQRAGAGPAQGRGQIMWNESGEQSCYRHAATKFLSALALLSEIPIENLRTVPSGHAISTQNLF